MEPQRKFIETDVKPFITTFVGIKAKPRNNPRLSKTLVHLPLNYGGMYLLDNSLLLIH